jgi:branched-chain amino acid transport system ATP-binding protein
MLAIGRCLMGDPQFIMLDEPSLGLAPLIVELVFSAIVKLRNSGITILLIEQNVAESLVVADHAAVLENGAVVLAGRAETVLADEGVKSAYLGL